MSKVQIFRMKLKRAGKRIVFGIEAQHRKIVTTSTIYITPLIKLTQNIRRVTQRIQLPPEAFARN